MNTIQFSRPPRFGRSAKIIAAVAGGFVMLIVFALVFGFLLKWLWNALMAGLFGLPMIGYWQAIGLFLLAKFFFGFGHGGSFPHRYRKPRHGQWQQWCGPVVEPVAGPGDDETLQQYWEQEGRAAYQAYLDARDQQRPDEPEL